MAATAAPAKKSLPQFRDIADRGNLPMDQLTYKRAATSTIALQKTGYMAGLSAVVEINITTSASGTFANKTGAIPTPENCIRYLRLKSQSGTTFYETHGFGNYLIQRVNRMYDYRNAPAVYGASNSYGQVFNLPSTYANSTTYTLRFPINLRNILGERELISLLLLEGTGTVYLDVVWADVETELLTLAGGGTITVNSIQLTPEADIFLLPSTNEYIRPETSPLKVVTMTVDSITNTGYDKYSPPNGGTLLRMIVFYTNGDGTRIPCSQMGNYLLRFGGIMAPERGKVQNFLYQQLWRYEGYALPDGVMAHDFLGGNGDGARMPGLRDTIPVREANDIMLETEILPSTTIVAGATRTVILERLLRASKS